jgi:uncharacterized protein YkwD
MKAKLLTLSFLLGCITLVAQCPRATMVTNYNTVYLGSAVSDTELAWTGNSSTCTAGTISTLAKTRTLNRINYFRQLVGLPGNITFDPALNTKCQEAALMMRANNQLSHFPPTSWLCYTADGALAASKSNISGGGQSQSYHSAATISGQINDAGTGNTAVGHRRWILYTKASIFGHGSTLSSSALWVVNSTAPAAPIDYVAFPSAGFFPAPLVPLSGRWSFGKDGADFTNATVQMTDNSGVAVSTTLETLTNGYGDNTLVWKPTGIITTSQTDLAYTVNVNNVIVSGASQNFTYVVKICQAVHPPQCPIGKTWSESSCDCVLQTDVDQLSAESQLAISIYPNPASNNINLVLNTNEDLKEAIVELFDISGRKISSEKINEKTLKIDVSSLSNGMYYIVVENNGKQYKDKIIVNK